MKKQLIPLLEQALQQLQAQGFITLPSHPLLQLERPKDPNHGDYSCNIAMVLAKSLKMNPRVLAEHIIQALPCNTLVQDVTLAGPGFINMTLTQEALQKELEAIAASPLCGIVPITEKRTLVIDYSSPNLAKEMHVGHLRSTIIGDTLSKVFSCLGFQVIRQNHIGDWGTQFGMLLAHLEDAEKDQDDTVALEDLEVFYQAAKNQFDKDEHFATRARKKVVLLQSHDPASHVLWQRFIALSLSHCQAMYSRLQISLQPQDVRGESAYNALLPMIVESLKKQGLLVENEGALCVFLPEFIGKNQEPLPIIVQKKDGGFLYASTDLATIYYRQHTLQADTILYVVDARQSLHFQQIFTLARLAQFAKPSLQLEHVSFGMVLDDQGKPFKTRSGGVTKLKELLDEAEKRAALLVNSKNSHLGSSEEQQEIIQTLAMAAIKYADLSKNRTSDYLFDWDTMLSFEGNTAPYLLYAYTRIQSLLAKAPHKEHLQPSSLVFASKEDLALAKEILLFPEVVENVAAKTSPHLLCSYLYELAGIFSSFYENCPILHAPEITVRISRLRLAQETARILALGLSLLGINTLQKM